MISVWRKKYSYLSTVCIYTRIWLDINDSAKYSHTHNVTPRTLALLYLQEPVVTTEFYSEFGFYSLVVWKKKKCILDTFFTAPFAQVNKLLKQPKFFPSCYDVHLFMLK